MRWGILGPVLVCDDAGTEITLPSGRLRVLVAALLVRANHVIPVDELVELVWDGAPPAGAVRTLRVHVVRLRRALGAPVAARIVTQPAGYVCRAAEDELDVLRFGKLCAQARSAAREGAWPQTAGLLAEALGLWRGTPLADVPSDLLLQRELAGLEHMHIQAVEDHLDARMHLGQHEQLLPQLRDLIARHPLRERPHAHLMRALAGCGRRAEALQVYQDARSVLASELGIEPGPELRSVQQAILAGAEPPPPADMSARAPTATVVPRQLPAAPVHFTGRDAEVDELAGLLPRAGQATGAGGTVVISAIGGMPGVGKTALAVHWAHQVADRFPDGQLYVNLRGFAPSGVPATPAEAVRGLLDALDVPTERIPPTPDAQAGLYRSLLAGKRTLVVLDNARDEQQVRPLLPASPASLVIITSRNQLAGLAAADGARLLNLDVLTHGEAVQLLSARIGNSRAAAEPDAVGEIAALCACLPLALAVAAARAAARPRFHLTELAAELRSVASRLDALDAGDPAVSVRALFSWSYQQLRPGAARMFRLLGLHPGPDISVAAAASLAAVDEPQARRLLRELARDCLITEHTPGRYAFHDLLRAYAAEKARECDSQPDRDAAIGRVLDHYLHTAARACLLLHPARETITLPSPRPGAAPEQPVDHRQALDWFEAEHQVLVTAVTFAARIGADSHAWRLPTTLAEYLYRRGHSHEVVTTLGSALAAATRIDDALGQAISLRALGSAYIETGNFDHARAHLEHCLPLYQRLDDRMGETVAQHNLSRLAEIQGRYADALGHNEKALRLYQGIGHEVIGHEAREAQLLNGVAWCHALLGDYQQARAFCQQSLALIAKLDRCTFEYNIWDTLGYIELHLGDFAGAAAHFELALALCRDDGDRINEAEILTHVGDAHHAASDLPQARRAWQQALAIYDDIQHPDAGKVRAKLASAED